MRATLRLSSPAWLVHPKITSSMPAGSRPFRSTSARITPGRQVVRAHRRERAAVPSNGGAHGVDDDRPSHASTALHRSAALIQPPASSVSATQTLFTWVYLSSAAW